MKTAMQKLITNLETMGITFPQGIQQTFLSIEKEQIEHAHAHHRCLHDKTMECTIEAYKSAEKYYNQTYKPETI